jgi:chromosome partitioning protein
MKIIVANQKGGAGKSTLCILLANYLSIEKKEEVLILDMDFQSSVYEKWETDWETYKQNIRATVYAEIINLAGSNRTFPDVKPSDAFLIELIDQYGEQFPDLVGYKGLLDGEALEETRPYQVIKQDLADYPKIKTVLSEYQDGYIVMDLPGKMDDDDLVPVYQDADLIIVPTGYDQMTNVATLTFAQVVNTINPDTKVVFIPNRIKPGVKYDLKADVHKFLTPFGYISEEVKDSVMFQRLNTYSISKDVSDNISGVFNTIYERFLSR